MRILVVGAGATGGFFGARLAQAGRDVTFLVRPQRAAMLRDRGLRIVGMGAQHLVNPPLVIAAEITAPYDVILFSVKATAIEQAMVDITPAVGPETSIVPFLNGMAHLDQLNDRFGRGAVLGGVVKVLSTLNDDGDIVNLSPMASLAIGEQDGTSSARLKEVAAAFEDAAFDFATSDDIVAAMWHKWVFISTLGALTCLMRGTVGEVVAVPDGDGLGPAILAEAAAVSKAAGFPLPAAELANITTLATTVGSPATASMYRDILAGRLTEVEHVFADLVDRARSSSVDTPLLALTTMQLRVYNDQVEARRS